VFVTAVDPSGTSLVFSTVIGGSGESMPTSIARDNSGHIYVAGTCNTQNGLTSGPSPDFPVTSDAMQPFWGPAFLMKLSPDASTLLYSTFVGRFGLGTRLGGTFPQQIKLDSEGKVHMLISSEESDIPLSGDGYNPCYPEPDSQITTNWLHFTYVRFSDDLKQIEYATNVPGMWGLPPYFFDTSGNFYLGFEGPLTTSRHPVGYFTILDASQAPNPGPVCIAESVTKTLTSTAPGLLMSVYGPGTGPAQPTWAVPVAGVVPNQMAGVQVLFDGVAAPILFGNPNEVDVVVPFGVRTSGTVTISVVREGNVLGVLYNNAVAANPYLFSVDGTGYGASGWYADGTPNSPSKPASVGDVLTFYGTGVGNVISPLPDGSIPTSANAFSASALSVCYGVNTYVGDAPGQVEGVVQVNCRLASVVNPTVGLGEPGGASSWSASNILYVN
jgi:uncharacterized protein (TIGR03437 family)